MKVISTGVLTSKYILEAYMIKTIKGASLIPSRLLVMCHKFLHSLRVRELSPSRQFNFSLLRDYPIHQSSCPLLRENHVFVAEKKP